MVPIYETMSYREYVNINTIAETDTFSVNFNDGVEEWNPFEAEGWKSRQKTAKDITISVSGKRKIGDTGNDLSVSGKRKIGDTGNDFVAGLAFENGTDSEADFEWTFPDGTVVKFSNAVINVTALGSSDSTAVAPLEFEVMSNGKPTVTPAS